MIDFNLGEIEKKREGKCGACKLYENKKKCCPAFPHGIPQAILDGESKHWVSCVHWVAALTRKELKESLLCLSDTKKGAEFRILSAAKQRPPEPLDPRDLAMLDNKQGRPHNDPFETALREADIMEDYGEFRFHGVQYDVACEIVAYCYNVSAKHIKAIITAWTNSAKKSHFKYYPMQQNVTGETAEEAWERISKEHKAYLRECQNNHFLSK
ncbi:MAG: hypothetical protein Q7U88_07105 [Desulfocapsaceae bacterium]|nr:hypothetical protein [Desulfocapsaceae bacterium]